MKEIIIDSRVETVKFYERLGFEHGDDSVVKCGNFECIRMYKIMGKDVS